MVEIQWDDFAKIDMRVGRIVKAETYPEARRPAYRLEVDFGPDIGVKKSSAQITALYTTEELVGKQVIGVVNFGPKMIGKFRSECLVTGVYREDGNVVLAVPDKATSTGAKLG